MHEGMDHSAMGNGDMSGMAGMDHSAMGQGDRHGSFQNEMETPGDPFYASGSGLIPTAANGGKFPVPMMICVRKTRCIRKGPSSREIRATSYGKYGTLHLEHQRY